MFAPDAEISVGRDIKVTGDRGTAVVREQNGNVSKLSLVRQSAQWRIDGVTPADVRMSSCRCTTEAPPSGCADRARLRKEAHDRHQKALSGLAARSRRGRGRSDGRMRRRLERQQHRQKTTGLAPVTKAAENTAVKQVHGRPPERQSRGSRASGSAPRSSRRSWPTPSPAAAASGSCAKEVKKKLFSRKAQIAVQNVDRSQRGERDRGGQRGERQHLDGLPREAERSLAHPQRPGGLSGAGGPARAGRCATLVA